MWNSKRPILFSLFEIHTHRGSINKYEAPRASIGPHMFLYTYKQWQVGEVILHWNDSVLILFCDMQDLVECFCSVYKVLTEQLVVESVQREEDFLLFQWNGGESLLLAPLLHRSRPLCLGRSHGSHNTPFFQTAFSMFFSQVQLGRTLQTWEQRRISHQRHAFSPVSTLPLLFFLLILWVKYSCAAVFLKFWCPLYCKNDSESSWLGIITPTLLLWAVWYFRFFLVTYQTLHALGRNLMKCRTWQKTDIFVILLFIEIESYFPLSIEHRHTEHNTCIWKGHVVSAGKLADWFCGLFCRLHITK